MQGTHEELADAIGMELRRARESLEFSRRQLETLTGVREVSIWRVETGKRLATLETLQRLLGAMGAEATITGNDIRVTLIQPDNEKEISNA